MTPLILGWWRPGSRPWSPPRMKSWQESGLNPGEKNWQELEPCHPHQVPTPVPLKDNPLKYPIQGKSGKGVPPSSSSGILEVPCATAPKTGDEFLTPDLNSREEIESLPLWENLSKEVLEYSVLIEEIKGAESGRFGDCNHPPQLHSSWKP